MADKVQCLEDHEKIRKLEDKLDLIEENFQRDQKILYELIRYLELRVVKVILGPSLYTGKWPQLEYGYGYSLESIEGEDSDG